MVSLQNKDIHTIILRMTYERDSLVSEYIEIESVKRSVSKCLLSSSVGGVGFLFLSFEEPAECEQGPRDWE